MVALHADPTALAHAFTILKKFNIVDDQSLVMVALHPNPKSVAYSYAILECHAILAATREMVATHPNPQSLAYALCILKRDGIVDDVTRAQLAEHQHPQLLVYPFILLNIAGILSANTRDIIARTQGSVQSLQYVWAVTNNTNNINNAMLDKDVMSARMLLTLSDLYYNNLKERRKSSLFSLKNAIIMCVVLMLALSLRHYWYLGGDLAADAKHDYLPSNPLNKR